MEYCRTHQIYDESTTIPQLKTALLTMHQLQLVHLDIKPENLAYSPYFKKNVFIDFGFSQFINESLGQKTITSYIGTYEYSSP
jgi:serine/threonine protein kinase